MAKAFQRKQSRAGRAARAARRQARTASHRRRAGGGGVGGWDGMTSSLRWLCRAALAPTILAMAQPQLPEPTMATFFLVIAHVGSHLLFDRAMRSAAATASSSDVCCSRWYVSLPLKPLDCRNAPLKMHPVKHDAPRQVKVVVHLQLHIHPVRPSSCEFP